MGKVNPMDAVPFDKYIILDDICHRLIAENGD